jgi:hypothetical protein
MYGFVRRDVRSSVYKAVSDFLVTNSGDDWRKLPVNAASFNLIFGERNKLPFGRLGQCEKLTWETSTNFAFLNITFVERNYFSFFF